jgi:hypothetical protein
MKMVMNDNDKMFGLPIWFECNRPAFPHDNNGCSQPCRRLTHNVQHCVQAAHTPSCIMHNAQSHSLDVTRRDHRPFCEPMTGSLGTTPSTISWIRPVTLAHRHPALWQTPLILTTQHTTQQPSNCRAVNAVHTNWLAAQASSLDKHLTTVITSAGSEPVPLPRCLLAGADYCLA